MLSDSEEVQYCQVKNLIFCTKKELSHQNVAALLFKATAKDEYIFSSRLGLLDSE